MKENDIVIDKTTAEGLGAIAIMEELNDRETAGVGRWS